ncbi:MAG: hypothetical protein LOD90_07075 [Symbiobacteriaceae bacterium]
MRRCAACGEELHRGDLAYADPHDSMTLYCSADCVADAWAETVIVDEEDLPYHGGPTWTYDEATEGMRRYLALRDRLRQLIAAWRLVADERDVQARHMDAILLRAAAAQVEDLLADVAATGQQQNPAGTAMA